MIGIRKGIAWERIREKNIGAGYRDMKAIDKDQRKSKRL